MPPKMPTPDPDALEVRLSDQAKAQIASDPALAEALRSFTANFRNAAQSVRDGRYPDMESALQALGMEPKPVSRSEAEALVQRLGRDGFDNDGNRRPRSRWAVAALIAGALVGAVAGWFLGAWLAPVLMPLFHAH